MPRRQHPADAHKQPATRRGRPGHRKTARRQAAWLAGLYRVAQSVMHLQDLPILARAVREQLEVVGDYESYMALVDGDELVLYGKTNERQFTVGGVGLLGWVTAHGQSLLVNDVSADPRFLADGPTDPTRAELVVPILLSDQVVGVLDLHGDRVGAFTEADLQFAESLASFLAVAVQNARLYIEAQRQADRLALVSDIAAELTILQPITSLLENTVQAICERLGYGHAAIGLIEEGTYLKFEAHYDRHQGFLRTGLPRFRIGEQGITGRVATTGEAVIVSDIRTHPEYIGRPGQSLSELAVPIRIGQRILGVINVESPQLNAFTDYDHQLIQTLADQVAVALENARLYQMVRNAQAQLVQSERLRAVGELASGVAHNFNNVLTSIMGYSEMLLLEANLSAFHPQLRIIMQSARQGAAIARRLQDFTRAQTATAIQSLDLNEVIEQTLLMTQPRWKDAADDAGRSINVVTHLAMIPTIRGNPPELIEVFTNLIFNAVDAMPDGGTLTITTATVDEQVMVMVADTGFGMDTATQARIFEPFFTTKGPALGTGLGLSVSHGIVQRHKGTISVTSEPGTGTTFTLIFPVLLTPA